MGEVNQFMGNKRTERQQLREDVEDEIFETDHLEHLYDSDIMGLYNEVGA